ncbi:MAG: hypothetical protein KGM91_20090 [Burkholderiales bacterium]|nr:hypothetical protein [Burkholderiales bacterium]
MVETLNGGERPPGEAEAPRLEPQRAVAVRALLEPWSEAVIRCGPEQPAQDFGTHLDAMVAWH